MVLHTPFVPIATGVLNIKHVLCISTFFLPRLCFNFNFSGWCSWVSFEMAVGFPHCQSIETNFCIIHGGTFSCFSCTKFGDLFVQCLGPYFFTAATHKQKTPTPKQKAKNNVKKPPQHNSSQQQQNVRFSSIVRVIQFVQFNVVQSFQFSGKFSVFNGTLLSHFFFQ